MQTSLFDVGTTSRCELKGDPNGTIALITPYNRAMVDDLKSCIPSSDRKWDPDKKVWIVDSRHGALLAKLITQYFNETVTVPTLLTTVSKTVTKILNVRYIGACKDRSDGSKTAMGYINGSWSVIFPENVLREYFDPAPSRVGDQDTLYTILGINKTASIDAVKSAFRRLARQWHPDVCREVDAAEQFKKINHAYQVLSDEVSRGKYDAGLRFQASVKTNKDDLLRLDVSGYRCPLRCGYIMCEGVEKLGRLSVSKILAWEDITECGRTLVVSYPMGATAPVESWV